MPSYVIIEKSGSLKIQSVKKFEPTEIYKKCGFKTNDGFTIAHTWTLEFNDIEYKLEVYGKTTGKANTENKYEFPPPIDNVLFFGNCAAVLYVDEKMTDMGSEEFKDIMDHLYGGYSDIDDEDEDDDDEEDELGLPKTKHGYVKDDFVVSSDAEDEEDDVSEDDIVESDEEIKPKRKLPLKPKKPKKPKLNNEESTYAEMTEELREEDYL